VGSSDHALYILDVDKAKKKRQLYNKNNGHAEWVTCVTYLSNGAILSGGMDGKLCLWSGTRATDLHGTHNMIHLSALGAILSGGAWRYTEWWHGRQALPVVWHTRHRPAWYAQHDTLVSASTLGCIGRYAYR
jgi:WD40 repeat protein